MNNYSGKAEAKLQPFNQQNDSESFVTSEVSSCEGSRVTQGEKMEKFELKLTATLYRKLCEKSKKEGVTVNELASELLAEGLVLRAWEIMERKIAMKQPTHSNSVNNNSHSQVKQSYKSFGNRSRNNYNSFQGNNKNNLSQQNNRRGKYSNRSVDDNANFIEYVRNQEKKNSW